VLQALAAALLIGSLSHAPSEPAAWLAGKVVIAAIVTAAVGWRGNFLLLARPS
jgi:hypothetical protein